MATAVFLFLQDSGLGARGAATDPESSEVTEVMARSGHGDIIDFPALERELQGALEAEERYARENEAKLRAVHQKVASYSEFRDLVVTSHLKPLDPEDRQPSGRKHPWNPVAGGRKSS